MLVESLLEPCLILLQATGASNSVSLRALLLHESLVLNEGLLQVTSQTHALLSIGLYLVVILTGLTHLDVLFKLFNLAILHRALKFELAILALQLLDQERLKIVCLAAGKWRLTTAVHVIDLLLELAGQVLYVLLLPLQVDIRLFGLCAQTCIFVPSNIVLNLEVPVHVADLFFLNGFENRLLVSFDHISVAIHSLVDATATTRCRLGQRGALPTGKQNIA